MSETSEPGFFRLMTAPEGEWPRRTTLGDRAVVILYRDFHGQSRSWLVYLIEARQSDETVLLEVKREGEKTLITLRLHRVVSFHTGGQKYQPMDYFADVLGLEIKKTQGPRSTLAPGELKPGPTGPLANMLVAFSGQFDRISRAQTTDIVARCGGTAVGTVTAEVAILVVGNGGVQKEAAARRLGIRCVTEAAFIDMIGGLLSGEDWS